MRSFAVKIGRVLAVLAASSALLACQGMYVAGDAGPHSTQATTTGRPPPDR